MATIQSKTYFVNGGVPTAAQLNAPYDDLQASTINSENTATGWATWKHLVTPGTSATTCNDVYEYSNPTTTQTNYNNTSYAAVAQGGNNCRVTLGFTPLAFEGIRFHGSLLVGTLDVATDYDYVAPNGKPNFYAFRIVVNTTFGGVTSDKVVGEWGYSFTTKTYGPLSSGGGFTVLAGPIQWQTGQFSAMYWPNNDATTFNYAELQVKVQNNTNTVGITRHAIQVIRGKR
jgi:hypothetical protein